MQDVEVVTSRGRVRGRSDGGVAAFLGIPYAEPPVGRLRFAAPEPAAGWDGVRDASSFGPPPPQVPVPGMPPVVRGPDGDNWLTLNVWTPEAGGRGLPVMVYVYGGAYRMGHAGDPGWDGAVLAGEGVVVVTANHRVGMEGYAHLAGAPDNRALLDQIAVLAWVQAEVTQFGGDPGRVTVFGESAGAGAVANLLVTPAAAQLFGSAIAQSVPGTYLTPRLAADVAAELVAPTGRAAVADDLRDTDPDRLATAAAALDGRMGPFLGRSGPLADRWGPLAGTLTPFSPVVDGELLPDDPWSALAAGAGRDVRLLVGHTRDEWRLFLAAMGLFGRIGPDDADWAEHTFAPGNGSGVTVPDASPEDRFALAQSDWLFRMPSLHLASAQVAGGGTAFLYELGYRAPAAGGLLGACHTLDIPLVFGTLVAYRDFFGEPAPPDAAALSGRMRSAWVAMAGRGDPGWPAFDRARRNTMVFDSTPGAAKPYPEEASRAAWAGHRFAALDLR